MSRWARNKLSYLKKKPEGTGNSTSRGFFYLRNDARRCARR